MISYTGIPMTSRPSWGQLKYKVRNGQEAVRATTRVIIDGLKKDLNIAYEKYKTAVAQCDSANAQRDAANAQRDAANAQRDAIQEKFNKEFALRLRILTILRDKISQRNAAVIAARDAVSDRDVAIAKAICAMDAAIKSEKVAYRVAFGALVLMLCGVVVLMHSLF